MIDAHTRKGILVDATPRQEFVVVGKTDGGVPLVEHREIWIPHYRTCNRPDK
jgi:hypothetical protein